MKSFLSILLILLSITALAQPTLKKRVIATSYSINGGISDSNHYYYSMGRGSANTTKESYFDNYSCLSTGPQDIRSDSSISWTSGSSSLLRNETRIYKYNSDGTLIDMVLKNTSYATSSRSERYYNSSKQLVGQNYTDTMNGTEIANDFRYYFYNTSGKLTVDSQYSQKNNFPVSVIKYSYNIKNYLTKEESYVFIFTGWILDNTSFHSYDAQDRKTLYRSDFGTINASKIYESKDSFSYAGTYKFPATKHHYTWDTLTSSWKNDYYHIYHYNSKDLIDTTYLYKYSTQWDTTEMNVNTYDTAGLLLYSKSYQYNTATGTYRANNYDELKIYYEDYDPSLSISNTAITHNITVTPNPSKGIISVNTNTTTFSHVSITDMQGRIVYNKAIPETNNTVINTQLVAGTYILTIHNKQQTKINSTQLVIQ
ncbi:MAG: T9SS type A sorting domain-containing protein [Chitinophagales bacterium]|nr:T9SS type A sorting domain-containing protein [Chitinophagales bacterium]